jgi:hypothetical protein
MEIIVSYHPGGAEQISEYVKKNVKKKKFIFFLSGPAIKIFRNKIGRLKNNDVNKFSFKNIEKKISFCLIGSGSSSIFEINHLKYLKAKKLKTIVFLDHWSNYKNRFYFKKRYEFPDEIWVSNIHAFKKAKSIFNVPVKLKENLLLKNIKKKYSKLKKEKNFYLFLSQPLKEHSKIFIPQLRYNQFTAFDYLYEKKNEFMKKKKILIKVHPLEKVLYWKKFIKKKYKFLKIEVIQNKDLISVLSKSEIVFGCASTAMYISSELGIKTFSCIPPGGKKSSIPSNKIKDLRRV